jgi:hypothetical protein
VTVAGELCPVIWFLSHTAALPFLEKKMVPCIFTGLVSLLSGYSSYIDVYDYGYSFEVYFFC